MSSQEQLLLLLLHTVLAPSFWTCLIALSPIAVDPQGHASVGSLPLPLLLHSTGILYGVCTPPPRHSHDLGIFGSLERGANGAQKAQIVTSNILKSKLSSAYIVWSCIQLTCSVRALVCG